MPPRKRLRLPFHDYAAPGAYFVTACTHDRACLFGRVSEGVVELSEAGEIVEHIWQKLPAHYPGLGLDEFIVMPNHIHGVLVIQQQGGHPLSEVMRAFKAFSTREIRAAALSEGVVWQRGYYEHVVRDDNDLAVIREYIRSDPLKWDLDDENPMRKR